MTGIDVAKLQHFLEQCSEAERRELFRILRREFPIHPFEQELNTTAESILEAISRATDLTIRGVRGIIAEAEFQITKIPELEAMGFTQIAIDGDKAYDFLVEDPIGPVRIQVKMQRRRNHQPLLARQAHKGVLGHCGNAWVAETQRTRRGVNTETGGDTRPYRFGEFDILAVAMAPSTGNWTDFMYTVERWLIPTPGQPEQVFKLQPVSRTPDGDYTDDIGTCIQWLRSDMNKVIYSDREYKLF